MFYTPADPSNQSVRAYTESVVTDPRNYLLVVYVFASIVVGITVVFTLALTLMATPVLC